jgi:hypothetical protein
MKAAALAFLGTALSLALPATAPAQRYDQKVGGTTAIKPHEQQAQLGSGRDHDRYCQGLKQRAQELRDDASRSRDHGDFAHARDQLDQITERLRDDCNR